MGVFLRVLFHWDFFQLIDGVRPVLKILCPASSLSCNK